MTTTNPNPYVAIVDDDGAIRTALGRALRMENYDVDLFEDGNSALKSVQLRAPDAIILDLQLPDIDGLEVCRQLNMDTRTGSIPVIFVSARLDLAKCLETMSLPVAGCLTKPVALRDLVQSVSAAVFAEAH